VEPRTGSPRGAGNGACADPTDVAHAEKASWFGEQPQFWSKAQVLDWISYQVEKNKYDASSIDFSRCDMDGATLCNCALEELRLVFGPLGDQLHAQLRDLSESRLWVPQGSQGVEGSVGPG
jgi:E74-like factor 3